MSKKVRSDSLLKIVLVNQAIKAQQEQEEAVNLLPTRLAILDAIISAIPEEDKKDKNFWLNIAKKGFGLIYSQDILIAAQISAEELLSFGMEEKQIISVRLAGIIFPNLGNMCDSELRLNEKSFKKALTNATIDGVSIFEFTKKEDPKLFKILCDSYRDVAEKFFPEVSKIFATPESLMNPQQAQTVVAHESARNHSPT